jgi:phosphoribosylglycinamide formyltransferase-1
VRLAVLVSGSGTICDALLAAGLPVALVVADRPCRALELAERRAAPTVLLDRHRFGGFGPRFDRPAYSGALAGLLQEHDVQLVAMAGFGTVLAEPAHQALPGRLLNTHPSLLPAFPGWHAVEDALAAGVAVTGCTVHVAGLAVDSGPVLAQQEVAVLPGDDPASLHERIKTVERWLYPATIQRALAALASGQEPAELPCLRGSLAEPLDPGALRGWRDGRRAPADATSGTRRPGNGDTGAREEATT